MVRGAISIICKTGVATLSLKITGLKDVIKQSVRVSTSFLCFSAIFVGGFSLAYLISPRFCHRFVGYLEEEAVKTYTLCLQEIDEGKLKMWCRMKAPEIAVEYWKLAVGVDFITPSFVWKLLLKEI